MNKKISILAMAAWLVWSLLLCLPRRDESEAPHAGLGNCE
jgi:hypothetical protein